ncbi:MAG: hypothetical protein WCK78_01525 [Paludibacter sp.]
MNRNLDKILIVWLFCFLVQTGKAAEKMPSTIKDTVEINNPYFYVLRNSSANVSTDTSKIGKRVVVALNPIKIKTAKKNILLNRGQIAVFQPKETYQVVSGNFFEVGFKSNHPELKRPEEWIEPMKNKVVYDDPEIRVFEERLEPQDIREVHSHAQRVVVRFNLVQLTDPRFHDVPKPGSGIQIPNTVKYAEPIVHAVKNTSDIPLYNVVVEYKLEK